jgi:hypothetical protein
MRCIDESIRGSHREDIMPNFTKCLVKENEEAREEEMEDRSANRNGETLVRESLVLRNTDPSRPRVNLSMPDFQSCLNLENAMLPEPPSSSI